jgi:hypothetical protein
LLISVISGRGDNHKRFMLKFHRALGSSLHKAVFQALQTVLLASARFASQVF